MQESAEIGLIATLAGVGAIVGLWGIFRCIKSNEASEAEKTQRMRARHQLDLEEIKQENEELDKQLDIVEQQTQEVLKLHQENKKKVEKLTQSNTSTPSYGTMWSGSGQSRAMQSETTFSPDNFDERNQAIGICLDVLDKEQDIVDQQLSALEAGESKALPI